MDRIEYGFFVEQVHPIVTTNLLGLFAGAYYLMTFYRFTTRTSFGVRLASTEQEDEEE